ncbi:MAG TPA: MFS transporter, partial [Isosphaeraceae bacterium]|nr:MFS transporter [Isosphaeraceae bacterium]
AWNAGITGYHWLVLVIASAGWVFDVYEGQLFTIYKTPALAEVLGHGSSDVRPQSKAGKEIDYHGNVALALFLVGGAVGGLGFGILGDRIGRVRVMSVTILWYSVFSGLTSLAQTVWHIDILRFLVAMGTGGEWAIAAALVAESFPTRARAFASGTFHASSVLGAALASWTGMVLSGKGGWRWGFLIGVAPALLILWIRLSLREPEGWQEARRRSAKGERLGSLSELLGDPRWRPRALLGLCLAAIGLGTYWAIFAWGGELARDVLRNTVSNEVADQRASFVYLLMNLTGGLLGLLSFAPLAQWRGRRFAFLVYQLGALIVAPVTYLGARTYVQTLWLLPTMAFFVVGMHAGYAIYFPELFPTRLRATGSSFCFNVGRLLGALILLIRGELGARLGLRHAVVVISSLFLVGIVLLAFAPETRGKSLPE